MAQRAQVNRSDPVRIRGIAILVNRETAPSASLRFTTREHEVGEHSQTSRGFLEGLPERVASIDDDRGAGDVAGGIAGEVDGQWPEIFRLSEVAGGDL